MTRFCELHVEVDALPNAHIPDSQADQHEQQLILVLEEAARTWASKIDPPFTVTVGRWRVPPDPLGAPCTCAT